MSTFAIQFDFPEGTVYAGMYKGAAGFAPTLATARLFADADEARRFLDNCYGNATSPWGKVIGVMGTPGLRRTG